MIKKISPKIQEIEKKINISKVENFSNINKLEDFILKKINYVKYNEKTLYYDTEDRDNLLNIHQRIISYYILYEISKEQKMESNQYLPIIIEMVKQSQNKNEQSFLVDFLYKQITYLNITVKNYLKDNSREPRMNLLQIQMQWDKYYKEMLNKKNINLKTNDIIRPVIYDRKQRDIKNIDNHTNLNLLMNDNTIEKEFNLNYFNPTYMSYNPTNNNFINSEPIWLLPSLKHNFIWEKKNSNEK